MAARQKAKVSAPWDDSNQSHLKEPWVLGKGKEKVSFTRSKLENGAFIIQKNKERKLSLNSLQARQTYLSLVEQGYKLRKQNNKLINSVEQTQ